MANKHNNLIAFDGTKAVTIWGDEGWQIMSGNDKERPDTEIYYSARVPMVFRGMQIRADAVASIPFEMVDDATDKTIDTSEDWGNVCGFLPSPEVLFWLIEAAWTISGRAYLYRNANANNYTKILRPLAPGSVTYSPDKDEFTRKVKGTNGTETDQKYPPAIDANGKSASGEAMVYLWLPDPDVEKGPPLKFPGKAALQAMGVLYNLDDAATGFFKRGMLHTYLFSVPPGTQQSDKDALEDKVKNMLSGIKNAWRTLFINAEKVTPIDIGGGLESLANVPLTKEKREDVSIALGIPMSILFSETARGLGGKGVVDADDRRLIELTALPEWNKIARELNRQVFQPQGYRLVEKHKTMPVFQENETERSAALTAYVNAYVADPQIADIMAQALGFTFPEDLQQKIDAILADKKAKADEMAKQTQPKEVIPSPAQAQANPTPGDPTSQANTQDMTAEKTATSDALEKWQRFELNHLGKKTKPEFVTGGLPPEMIECVKTALAGCKTADDIRCVFKNVIIPAKVDPVLRLALSNERLAQQIELARLDLATAK